MPPNRTGLFPDPPQDTARTNILSEHPYTVSVAGIVLLIVIGLIIVGGRRGVMPSGSGTTWGSGGSAFFTGARNHNLQPGPNPLDIIRQQAPESLSFTPISPTTVDSGETEGAFDFNALIAELSSPQDPETSAANDPTTDAYSYIPQGLISIKTANTQGISVTPGKENEIADYGNTVGSWIKEFEESHRSAPVMLRDHAEDRGNSEKAELVRRLGNDYQTLASELEGVQRVPEAAASVHTAYASSLKTLGENLIRVADAETDDEFLAAIETYNAGTEAMSKRFQAVAAFFVLHNVTFNTSEAGSIFMFNPSLSLN